MHYLGVHMGSTASTALLHIGFLVPLTGVNHVALLGTCLLKNMDKQSYIKLGA